MLNYIEYTNMMIDYRRLMFDKRLFQNELGAILGLPQSQVSLLVNGRRDTTQAHVDMLIAHFGAETIAKYTLSEDAVAAVTRPIATQTEATIVPASVVEEAKAEAIEEYKAEESVPILATDLVTATINVRKFVEKNADELDQIDPSKLLNNPDFAEMITGTSMLPTFAPNDKVFIKLLPDRSQLIDGKMYYFDLDNLPTMIRKVKFEEGNKLRLIAKNPAFADIIIDRTHILNIGKVVGMFRETFGDQYDEIDEIRKQKDTQIDNLIKQNTIALDSIGELISVIKNK